MYNVKWRTYSNINYETIVILCNWVDGLKNVSRDRFKFCVNVKN